MVCFQTKNTNLGKFLEGLAMEDAGIFYDHLVYCFTVFLVHFIVIWNIFPLLVSFSKKNLATLTRTRLSRLFVLNFRARKKSASSLSFRNKFNSFRGNTKKTALVFLWSKAQP
jgi:hypothetical protein